MALTLRPWQDSAINKALNWLDDKKKNNNKFLINAAPGSGKTICASVIAKKLIEKKEIDRVIIIAPRREVVKQWKEEFKSITGRSMLIITGKNEDMGIDICATWNALENIPEVTINTSPISLEYVGISPQKKKLVQFFTKNKYF